MRFTLFDFHKYGTFDRITMIVETNRSCYTFKRAGICDGILNLFPISGLCSRDCCGHEHHRVICKGGGDAMTFRMNVIFFDKGPGLIRIQMYGPVSAVKAMF